MTSRLTTSAPDLAHLLECAEHACDEKRGTVLRVCMQMVAKTMVKYAAFPPPPQVVD
jgi:hypothetical protein